MLFGSIKGYDIKEISMKRVEKGTFKNDLEAAGAPVNTYNRAHEALANKGSVYAFYNKKNLAACYVVTREPGNRGTNNRGTGNRGTEDNKTKKKENLRITHTFLTQEIQERKNECDEAVLTELKGEVALSDKYEGIIYDGKFIHPADTEHGPLYLIWAMAGWSFGVVYGLLFDDLALGMCIGFSLGVIFAVMGMPFSKKSAWAEDPLEEPLEEATGDAT